MEKWGSELTKASSKRGKWEQTQILLQKGIKMSWSGDVEGEHKGTQIFYLEQTVATSGGQGTEAEREEKGHTWVNASCSQTQAPGGIREVHTGRTQGTRKIAGMGTPWSAAGASCAALGEVQSLSPHA